MSFYGDHVLPRIINLMMNTKEDRKIRSRVCAGLTGEVVEIGFGTGHNLPYLPPEVKRLRAVEPSQLAVRLAHPRIAASPVAVEVVGLDGQRLPMADDTADSLLCTWSLCTIPDPVAAVAEMRPVLRPGGTLHFVEHGLAPDEPVRKWQHHLNGMQQRVAGEPDIHAAGICELQALLLGTESIDGFLRRLGRPPSPCRRRDGQSQAQSLGTDGRPDGWSPARYLARHYRAGYQMRCTPCPRSQFHAQTSPSKKLARSSEASWARATPSRPP